jgi:hypothetical protein
MPTRKFKIDAQLREAQIKKLIIQFSRPFEEGSFIGYVIEIGAKFFLLAFLDDGLAFKQYSCLRIADIRNLEVPAKRESFYQSSPQDTKR